MVGLKSAQLFAYIQTVRKLAKNHQQHFETTVKLILTMLQQKGSAFVLFLCNSSVFCNGSDISLKSFIFCQNKSCILALLLFSSSLTRKSRKILLINLEFDEAGNKYCSNLSSCPCVICFF